MQVRVMAACMESQIDKQEYTASAQSRGREGTGQLVSINSMSVIGINVFYVIGVECMWGMVKIILLNNRQSRVSQGLL